MATQALISPDEVAKLVSPIVKQANELVIASPEDHQFACTILTAIATRENFFEERHRPNIDRWHKGHKDAIADLKRDVDPLGLAKAMVKGKIVTYDNEQQRLRREKEAAEALALKKQQDEAALLEAQQLEASGDKELANLVLETAAAAPLPVVVLPPAVEKQQGVAMTTTWRWRPVDGDEVKALKLLVQAAAKDDSLLGFLCFAESAIGTNVRAQKKFTKIPGIEAYAHTGVSVKASR